MHALRPTHYSSSRIFGNARTCLIQSAAKNQAIGTCGGASPIRQDAVEMPGKRKVEDGDAVAGNEDGPRKHRQRVEQGSSISDAVPYSLAMRRPRPSGQATFKLLSYNVNGLRALMKKTQLSDLVRDNDADFLLLQETKLQVANVDDEMRGLCGQEYDSIWACSTEKKGYAGTAIFYRKSLGIAPSSVHFGFRDNTTEEYDAEGRLLTIEHDYFFLICAYVPNSGQKLERLKMRINSWEERVETYLKFLESKGKPVIYAGDLNVAHNPIDLWGNHKQNLKTAGYTIEEREQMTKLLSKSDFIDTFRLVHGPNVAGFTYFSFRQKARELGRGWRLDYFLVSSSLQGMVHDSFIVEDFGTSDHQPIGLELLRIKV